jgi:hypothetical protein
MRRAAKRDTAERPIIQALEQCGFEVWALTQPCDLAVRRSSWPGGRVQLLEVKTPYGKAAKPRLDKRQEGQANFLTATGTPVVTTPVEALKALDACST